MSHATRSATLGYFLSLVTVLSVSLAARWYYDYNNTLVASAGETQIEIANQ